MNEFHTYLTHSDLWKKKSECFLQLTENISLQRLQIAQMPTPIDGQSSQYFFSSAAY